jgi:hypothetical protein
MMMGQEAWGGVPRVFSQIKLKTFMMILPEMFRLRE